MCTAVATQQNCCRSGGDIGPAGAGAEAAAAAIATHSFPDRERVGQTAQGFRRRLLSLQNIRVIHRSRSF